MTNVRPSSRQSRYPVLSCQKFWLPRPPLAARTSRNLSCKGCRRPGSRPSAMTPVLSQPLARQGPCTSASPDRTRQNPDCRRLSYSRCYSRVKSRRPGPRGHRYLFADSAGALSDLSCSVDSVRPPRRYAASCCASSSKRLSSAESCGPPSTS